MIRKLLIIIFLTIQSLLLFGQKQKMFHMVELPDSTTNILMQYLKKKEKLQDECGGLYVFNLQKPKDYKYKDGIYVFRLVGSNFHRRIFIVDGTIIKIFDSEYISDLLDEFNSFIRQSTLSTKMKIKYLKAISSFLEEEYYSENN